MNYHKKQWLEAIGVPSHYAFIRDIKLINSFTEKDFYGELYMQANGPGTYQRILMLFPKNSGGPVPGVLVPFYFPEAMLGYNPFDHTDDLSKYNGIEMMLHLVKRGYAVASADSYHLTYIPESGRERGDTWRWREAGAKLQKEHPGWSGIGKLIFDTQLMLDAFSADNRVDQKRIGIAGHSLGGKMAFYTGCLDERIKVILASDFGICWKQTNWNDIWYWGEKVDRLIEAGMEHSSLLDAAAPKPFFLLAGQYDNEESLIQMKAAKTFAAYPECFGFCNHASGHRPPKWALEEGYAFLDKWLKY